MVGFLTGETLSPGTARCPIASRREPLSRKRALAGETAIAQWKMVICRENVLPGDRAGKKRKKTHPQTAAA